jgi:membrane-associated protein
VAGVASMETRRFLLFNVSGGMLWVFSLVTAGYFLGSLPFVQNNFSLIVYTIILISVLPIVIGGLRNSMKKK